MVRVSEIENGVVVNVSVWDELPTGAIEGGEIGDLWDGHTFTKPPPPPIPVPQSVTMRQARLALLAAGLLPAVNAAIAAMPEPDKTAAQITWEFAATVDRGFGMVPQLAAALGMTETQIDNLFIEAAQL